MLPKNMAIPQTATSSAAAFEYQEACRRLRAAGLRLTAPRMALIGAMIGNRRPLSIEALHTIGMSETCDLVTVYRCLDAFESIGLVRRSFRHDGACLYELEGRVGLWVHARDGGDPMPIADARAAETVSAVAEIAAHLVARGYTHVTPVLQFFADRPHPEGTVVAESPGTAFESCDERTIPSDSPGAQASLLVAQRDSG